MIGLPSQIRVWAYPGPCDMRKGHNGLLGLVERHFCRDTLGGDLFLFVNRCRTLIGGGSINPVPSPFCEPQKVGVATFIRGFEFRFRGWLSVAPRCAWRGVGDRVGSCSARREVNPIRRRP